MRSFSEMSSMGLIGYVIMAIGMLAALIVGLGYALEGKTAMDKAFGIFLTIISMFVSIAVFLVGLISTVPAENGTGFSVLGILTEIVVWGSLLPFVIVPVFIVGYLTHTYSQLTGTGSRKLQKGDSYVFDFLSASKRKMKEGQQSMIEASARTRKVARVKAW